jgi:AcrR family transcriptional regulator
MHRSLLPLLLAAAALAAGCASTVSVRGEPAGARIFYRGRGRPTFRWTAAPAGDPATFRVYYSGLLLWASWPDGSQSAIEGLSLSNWRDPDTVVLRPDPSMPRLSAGAAATPPEGVEARPAGYRSAPAFDKRSVGKGDARAELPPPKLELPPPADD